MKNVRNGLLSGNRTGGYYEKNEFIEGCDDGVCDSDQRGLSLSAGLAAVARTQSGLEGERVHRAPEMAEGVDATYETCLRCCVLP